jgi:peptidoglycan hydrolase-like protein with peptidoglycan-binding domain
MAFSLTWLPSVLGAAGLKVALLDGWENRGHGDVDMQVEGVICHHTATSQKHGNMSTLTTLVDGRPNLSGPLSQLGLGRDGTFYIIAAGKCNHAGAGIWNGITHGNSKFIGIEAENTGGQDDHPWPEVQLDAYVRGVAAILGRLNKSSDWCAGHKEYALPRGRKPDPSFDMPGFRAKVQEILNGTAPAPKLIPNVDARSGKATLRRGANNSIELVKELQQVLHVTINGDFGPRTESTLRKFQLENNLVPDGIVGPKTWLLIDKVLIPL